MRHAQRQSQPGDRGQQRLFDGVLVVAQRDLQRVAPRRARAVDGVRVEAAAGGDLDARQQHAAGREQPARAEGEARREIVGVGHPRSEQRGRVPAHHGDDPGRGERLRDR